MNGIWFHTSQDDLDSSVRPSPAGSFPDLGSYENQLGSPVGIYETTKVINSEIFEIYPNPADELLNFELYAKNTIYNVEIYNISGQKVLTQKPISNTINVSKLTSGIYYIIVDLGDRKLNKKLIVK